MSLLLNKFDRWIHQSYPISPEQLGLYRMVYACFILFLIGTPKVAWLANMHPGMFHPPHPSIASLAFKSFPPAAVLHTLDVLMILLAFAILVGWKTRSASILFTLTVIFAKSFEYSLGKINHDLIVYTVPFVLAFANWGAAYSFDARRSTKKTIAAWPITLMAVLLCFCIFTAGYPKLLAGWLNTDTLAVKGKLFTHYFVQGRQDLLAGFFIGLQSPLFWEFNDWAAVLLELAFLPAIICARSLRSLIAVMLVFHTMVLLMLNIVFVPLYIVYLLIALPIIPLPQKTIARAQQKMKPWMLALLFLIYFLGHGLSLFPITLWGWFNRIPVPYLLPLLINFAAIGFVVLLTLQKFKRKPA